MQRTRFNKALNKETRFYNIQMGAFIGLITMGLICLIRGILFGFAGAGVGFLVGGYIYRRWHSGLLQRYFYWWCGMALRGRKLPPSYLRRIM